MICESASRPLSGRSLLNDGDNLEDDEGDDDDSDKESMKAAVVGVFLKLKFGINALRVLWIW